MTPWNIHPRPIRFSRMLRNVLRQIETYPQAVGADSEWIQVIKEENGLERIAPLNPLIENRIEVVVNEQIADDQRETQLFIKNESQRRQMASQGDEEDSPHQERSLDTEIHPGEYFFLLPIVGTFLWAIKTTHSLWQSLLVTLFIVWLIQQFYWRRRNLPPGPMPWPFIGNSLTIDLSHPASTFAKLHAQYGPVFTVWMPNVPMVVLADHEVLKEALLKNGNALAGRVHGYIWSMFTRNQICGDGIILSDGERWMENREFAHKIFRNMGLGRMQMEDKIKANIQTMVARIDQELGDSIEAEINMEEPIAFCVAHIIQDFVMGKSHDLEDPRITNKKIKKFKGLIDKVLADVTSKTVQLVNAYPKLAWLYFPAVTRYIQNGFSLQRYFLNSIHNHAEHLSMDGEPRDFIEAYLREMIKQKDNANFNHLTLALAAGDLWTGGMETTVTTIRWALIYMLYYPSVQQKCRVEIDEVFGTIPPSYGERKRLPYVEATIAEVLRLANVLPWAIPHRTLEEVTIKHYTIPVGTAVLPQYGTVQFDTYYFDEPEEFRPTRFIDEEGKYKKRPEMSPFGMGKRTCLGENLARYELFLIFTTLLQKYEFLPIEGVQLPSLKRSEGMTNVPQNYQIRVKARY